MLSIQAVRGLPRLRAPGIDRCIVQVHRVPSPAGGDALSRTVRRVLAYFYHPDEDFVVRCLDGSDTYAPITDLQFYAIRESQTLQY